MTAPSRQAGWFGKLPSLGDFAQRRLPPEFVQVWDDWLGAELARVRMRHDSGWLQACRRQAASPRHSQPIRKARPPKGVMMPSLPMPTVVSRY